MILDNKIFTLIILLVLGIMLSTILVQATDSPIENHYQITKSGGSDKIDEWSVCRQVTNNRSLNIFIPTKTSIEWAEFRFNHPNNITLRGCGNIDVDSTTQNSITLDYSFEGCTTNVYIFRGGIRIGSSLGIGDGSGTYTDTGLLVSTSYTYYLREGSSTLSTELDSTTDVTATPDASGNISVISKTQNSVNLSYDYANAGSVYIFRNNTQIQSVGSGDGSGTYNNTGLSAGTSYTYYLRNGSSSTSPELDRVSVTTDSPAASGNISVISKTQNSVNLSYDYTNAGSVYIFRNNTQIQSVGSGDGSGTYNNTGLSAGTSYTYYLRNGSSSTSPELDRVSVTTDSPAITTYTLSISKSGNGTVTSSPAGINCGSTCSKDYNNGDSVTLIASADSGYTFSGWSGGGCSGSGSCAVIVNSDKTVTATFTLSGGGTTPSCIGACDAGTCSDDCGASANCDGRTPHESWVTSGTCNSCGFCSGECILSGVCAAGASVDCGYTSDSTKEATYYELGTSCYYGCTNHCVSDEFTAKAVWRLEPVNSSTPDCNIDNNKACSDSVCGSSGWNNIPCQYTVEEKVSDGIGDRDVTETAYCNTGDTRITGNCVGKGSNDTVESQSAAGTVGWTCRITCTGFICTANGTITLTCQP